LVERANGITITGIMKSIFNQLKGKWLDELIKVVWSHNTAVSRSIGFTPFKLLFGDEAITPKKARTGSIRTLASAEDESDCQVTKDTICWGLVLKCYDLRTRQHKMLNVNVLRPSKHYFP
jgi:hypothetical protein